MEHAVGNLVLLEVRLQDASPRLLMCKMGLGSAALLFTSSDVKQIAPTLQASCAILDHAAALVTSKDHAAVGPWIMASMFFKPSSFTI